MTQETGNEWRMSKLKGLNVYNNNNEKLGSIDDILVDKQGQIKALVIGVGGFLGIGDHQVAVPFNQVQFVQDTNRNVAANNAATGTNNPPSRPANPAGDTTTSTGLGSPANPTGAPPNTATTTNTGAGTVNTAARRSDDAPDRAILNATRDQLKAAPQFKWNTAG
ncbi:MAG TPA: PRC-barrel domain-containing protein [Acetobacteraceae bacterium]|jgi:sporulation protein YlmC with PRC-barrel domain|nr:PRC-barrel domain-containing protein [Acetobacteraceae bacterium]